LSKIGHKKGIFYLDIVVSSISAIKKYGSPKYNGSISYKMAAIDGCEVIFNRKVGSSAYAI